MSGFLIEILCAFLIFHMPPFPFDFTVIYWEFCGLRIWFRCGVKERKVPDHYPFIVPCNSPTEKFPWQADTCSDAREIFCLICYTVWTRSCYLVLPRQMEPVCLP